VLEQRGRCLLGEGLHVVIELSACFSGQDNLVKHEFGVESEELFVAATIFSALVLCVDHHSIHNVVIPALIRIYGIISKKSRVL
jgi:hypothetical protein